MMVRKNQDFMQIMLYALNFMCLGISTNQIGSQKLTETHRMGCRGPKDELYDHI